MCYMPAMRIVILLLTLSVGCGLEVSPYAAEPGASVDQDYPRGDGRVSLLAEPDALQLLAGRGAPPPEPKLPRADEPPSMQAPDEPKAPSHEEPGPSPSPVPTPTVQSDDALLASVTFRPAMPIVPGGSPVLMLLCVERGSDRTCSNEAQRIGGVVSEPGAYDFYDLDGFTSLAAADDADLWFVSAAVKFEDAGYAGGASQSAQELWGAAAIGDVTKLTRRVTLFDLQPGELDFEVTWELWGAATSP